MGKSVKYGAGATYMSIRIFPTLFFFAALNIARNNIRKRLISLVYEFNYDGRTKLIGEKEPGVILAMQKIGKGDSYISNRLPI